MKIITHACAAFAAALVSSCTSETGPAQTIETEQLLPISATGRFDRIPEFTSQFIQPRGLTIWLPPGYSDENGPYPVIYAHDGQNLMEVEGSYRGVEWNLDEASIQLMEDSNVKPAIIVGIWNTDKRWWEYAPEKVIANLPDDVFAPSEENPEGGRPELYSDAYLRFIVEELKPYIDETYATAPERETTYMMGASMGGLMSLYALAEYPEIFSKAACISTHWPLAQPEGPVADYATQAMLDYLEQSKLGNYPQKIWFDHGTIELDQFYTRHSGDIETWFRSNEWDEKKAEFHIYENTGHKEEDWSARATHYLGFLLNSQ